MFFDPAIVATLKLLLNFEEQSVKPSEEKSARDLVLTKEKGRTEKSRKQRGIGFNLKRQS